MDSSYKAKRGEKREIILTPESAPIEYSLIWMHGLGDSADGFLPIFINEDLNPLTENFRVRLLTAPMARVTINQGMMCNSWYDIRSFDRSEDSIDFKEVQANSEYIQSIIQEEVDSHNGDPSKVFVGGFSQGCAMALHNGINYSNMLKGKGTNLAGIVALSGYLFPQTKLTEPEQTPPVLICHGEEDEVVNFKFSKESYGRGEFLKRKNVAFHPINLMHHELNFEVLKYFKEFVRKIVLKK